MNNSMQQQLPPGYHFEPRDQELILSYLGPRLCGDPYPSVMYLADKAIYGEKANPWDVLKGAKWVSSKYDKVHDGMITTYVFTNLLKPRNTSKDSWSRFDRKAGCGTWKVQSPGKDIMYKGMIVGSTRSFSFVHNSSYNDYYNRLVMHEYTLSEEMINCNNIKDKSLVLCKITGYHIDDKKNKVKQAAAGMKSSFREANLTCD